MQETISRSFMITALCLVLFSIVLTSEIEQAQRGYHDTTGVVAHEDEKEYKSRVDSTVDIYKSNSIEPLQQEAKQEYTYINDVTTFDIRTKSNITKEQIETYFNSKSFLYNLLEFNIAETLVEVEGEYNINSVFLLAIIRLESGNGTSRAARELNNLGGVIGKDGNYATFNSKQDCVLYMAEILSTNYLNESGIWYGGSYTVKDINKNYCETANWYEKIENLMLEIQWGILDDSIA